MVTAVMGFTGSQNRRYWLTLELEDVHTLLGGAYLELCTDVVRQVAAEDQRQSLWFRDGSFGHRHEEEPDIFMNTWVMKPGSQFDGNGGILPPCGADKWHQCSFRGILGCGVNGDVAAVVTQGVDPHGQSRLLILQEKLEELLFGLKRFDVPNCVDANERHQLQGRKDFRDEPNFSLQLQTVASK